MIPQRRQHSASFAAAYYAPVVAFLRARARQEEHARDMAHAFFARFSLVRSLGGRRAGRGRFRSYLLGAVKHFLADQRAHGDAEKRGAGVTPDALEWRGKWRGVKPPPNTPSIGSGR